jgi:hypothetical protein
MSNIRVADDRASDTGSGVACFASIGLNTPTTMFLRLAGTPLILERDCKLSDSAPNLFCPDGGKT